MSQNQSSNQKYPHAIVNLFREGYRGPLSIEFLTQKTDNGTELTMRPVQWLSTEKNFPDLLEVSYTTIIDSDKSLEQLDEESFLRTVLPYIKIFLVQYIMTRGYDFWHHEIKDISLEDLWEEVRRPNNGPLAEEVRRLYYD